MVRSASRQFRRVRWRFVFAGLVLAPSACGSDTACELGAFNLERCISLRATALPKDVPASPENPLSDHDDAARMGLEIFFDARFSRSQETRCASCHVPEYAFAEITALPEEFPRVRRNSPTIVDVARLTGGYFWDARESLLWRQPLRVLEEPGEMDTGRLDVVQLLGRVYRERYEALFGPLPELSHLPPSGRPGESAWETLSDVDKQAVNTAFENVGKTLEAYLRRVITGATTFDAFVRGEVSVLSDDARRGVGVFVEHGCLDCHNGPMLGGNGFARVLPDSDVGAGDGRFRIPPLRFITHTAPYGHAGTYPTLRAVIDAHTQGNDAHISHDALSDKDHDALLALLETMSEGYPPPPWNNWPDR